MFYLYINVESKTLQLDLKDRKAKVIKLSKHKKDQQF